MRCWASSQTRRWPSARRRTASWCWSCTPTRNPDPEAAERFKEVQEAWDRLNGKDTEATALDSATVANLCDLFVNVTGEVLVKGGDPCERDLKAAIKAKLNEHKRNVAAKIAEISNQSAKMERMLGRWKSGKDETPLEDVLRHKLAEAAKVLEAAERERELVERSLEMLAGWTFKQDVPKKPDSILDSLNKLRDQVQRKQQQPWKFVFQ